MMHPTSIAEQEKVRAYYAGLDSAQSVAPMREGEALSINAAFNEVFGTFDSIMQAMTLLEEKLQGVMRTDVNSPIAPGRTTPPQGASPLAGVVLGVLSKQRELQNRIGDLLGRVDL